MNRRVLDWLHVTAPWSLSDYRHVFWCLRQQTPNFGYQPTTDWIQVNWYHVFKGIYLYIMVHPHYHVCWEALATGSRWFGWQEKHKEVEGICAPIVSKYYGGGGAGDLSQNKLKTSKYWKEICTLFLKDFEYIMTVMENAVLLVILCDLSSWKWCWKKTCDPKWKVGSDHFWVMEAFFQASTWNWKGYTEYQGSNWNLLVLGKWTLGWCPKRHYVSVASSAISVKFNSYFWIWKDKFRSSL